MSQVLGLVVKQRVSRGAVIAFAAPPPAVRKGSAFPIVVSFVEAAPLMSRGGIASKINRGAGEAEPHRTEGGKAAEPSLETSSETEPDQNDRRYATRTVNNLVPALKRRAKLIPPLRVEGT